MEKCKECGAVMAEAGSQGEKCPKCGKMICKSCGCENCK